VGGNGSGLYPIVDFGIIAVRGLVINIVQLVITIRAVYME
jgi:hypothetical protein